MESPKFLDKKASIYQGSGVSDYIRDQFGDDGYEGDGPYICRERGFPEGVSIWVTGEFVRPEGALGKGPVPGLSLPPPSISKGRKRPKGETGRLPVVHHFLDVARYSLRQARRRRGPVPLCHDRLKGFRKQVWFLILAGYPPSFLQNFFLEELPNLFPKLSYWGVVHSVEIAAKMAEAGELVLEGEFLEILSDYFTGPWAPNAPDWLRKQYGVDTLEEKKAKRAAELKMQALEKKGVSRDSLESGEGAALAAGVPGGASSGLVPGVVSPGSRMLSEKERAELFFGIWEMMKPTNPSLERLTVAELSLGLSEGMGAVLALRESQEGLVSREVESLTPEVGPLAPEGQSGSMPGQSVSPEGSKGSVGSGSVTTGTSFTAGLKALALELSETEALLGEPVVLSADEKIQAASMGLGAFLLARSSGTLVTGSPVGGSVVPTSVAPVPSVPVPGAPVVAGSGDSPLMVPAKSGQDSGPEVVRDSDSEKSLVSTCTEKQKSTELQGIPEVVENSGTSELGSDLVEEEAPGVIPEEIFVGVAPVEVSSEVVPSDPEPVKVPSVVVVSEPEPEKVVLPPAIISSAASRKVTLIDPATGKEGSWVMRETIVDQLRKPVSELVDCPWQMWLPDLVSNIDLTQKPADRYAAVLKNWKDLGSNECSGWDQAPEGLTPMDICRFEYSEEYLDYGKRGLSGNLLWNAVLPDKYLSIPFMLMLENCLTTALSLPRNPEETLGWESPLTGEKKMIPMVYIWNEEDALALDQDSTSASNYFGSVRPLKVDSYFPRGVEEVPMGHIWLPGRGFISKEDLQRAISVTLREKDVVLTTNPKLRASESLWARNLFDLSSVSRNWSREAGGFPYVLPGGARNIWFDRPWLMSPSASLLKSSGWLDSSGMNKVVTPFVELPVEDEIVTWLRKHIKMKIHYPTLELISHAVDDLGSDHPKKRRGCFRKRIF